MTTFDALAARRRRAVESLRENDMESGFRKLLADLYPDNAHFIYELLQNAEDAGAQEVIFDLRPDGLRVEHNGTRLFDLKDIESITSIGQSTKADDAVAIGKFGVGFKAVFAYTQMPVIHSGEYSFAIQDLFVPERVTRDTRPEATTFWFPFDRPDKPAEKAVDEVSRSLRELSRSTLLFLNHISLISCSFPDGEERLLERTQIEDNINVVAIESVHQGTGPSYWYRITGDVDIDGKSFPVAAAFALQERAEQAVDANPKPGPPGKQRTAVPRFTVQPVDGQVFIYFPAVKETSGLKFHINAPFASTVARDSVRDDEGNNELVAGIASLLASALPDMKEAGLILDGLLEALPNHEDNLPARYDVIREQVVETFESKPITPVAGGRMFAESARLVRSVSQLRAALEPEDVKLLHSISTGEIEATGFLQERTGRAQQFLSSLSAIDFGTNELAEVFERVGEIHSNIEEWGDEAEEHLDQEDTTDLRAWNDWIAAKTNPSLRALYGALGRLAEEGGRNPYAYTDYRRHSWLDLDDVLLETPIVRIRLGDGVAHVVGEKAYLPTSRGLQSDGLVLDPLVPLDEGESKAAKQEANALRAFFSFAGVKPWDAVTQLNARLDAYQSDAEFDLKDHIEDLKALAQLLKEKAVEPSAYTGREILLTQTPAGELAWARPSSLYLDAPYGATGLAALYGSGPRRLQPLATDYLSYSDELDVAELARSLGAANTIEITSTSPSWGNPEFQHSWRWDNRENYNMMSRDWTIEYFDDIVATGDEALLRTLWGTIAAAPADRADAYYRANASAAGHSMRSQLLQKLTTVPWVLDRYGNLNLPEDMTAADLDEELQPPPLEPESEVLSRAARRSLLDRIGFGRKAAAEAARAAQDAETAKRERAHADETAQKLGFDSADDLADLAGLRKNDPERFDREFKEFKTRLAAEELQLPVDPSLSPERRAERAAGSARESAPRQYQSRARSVRIQEPGHLSAARNYLREMYTNDQGVMVCQVCHDAMPFRINGDYYFEAVQFVKDAQRDLLENRLALCPTCAAKYRYARGTLLEDLRDDLLTQSVGTQGSMTVDVELAGKAVEIRFVGKHAIDLQAALEASEDEPIDENPDYD